MIQIHLTKSYILGCKKLGKVFRVKDSCVFLCFFLSCLLLATIQDRIRHWI